MEVLKRRIRDIPDFPKPGIVFKDITPLLQDPEAFREAVDELDRRFAGVEYNKIIGIESRGFIFGSALAYKQGVGLVLVRKHGKLPYKTVAVSYDLEYGSDSVEIHEDGLETGDKVLIIDDLIATGGTVEATAKLARTVGAEVAGIGFVVELSFLNGRDRLKGENVVALLQY